MHLSYYNNIIFNKHKNNARRNKAQYEKNK